MLTDQWARSSFSWLHNCVEGRQHGIVDTRDPKDHGRVPGFISAVWRRSSPPSNRKLGDRVPMDECRGPEAEYLARLEAELRGRGVKCELVMTGCAPRLRLNIEWLGIGGAEDSAFEDHVLAAQDTEGRWRFWWPWIESIGPIDDLAGVADYIYRDTISLLEGNSERGDD